MTIKSIREQSMFHPWYREYFVQKCFVNHQLTNFILIETKDVKADRFRFTGTIVIYKWHNFRSFKTAAKNLKTEFFPDWTVPQAWTRGIWTIHIWTYFNPQTVGITCYCNSTVLHSGYNVRRTIGQMKRISSTHAIIRITFHMLG